MSSRQAEWRRWLGNTRPLDDHIVEGSQVRKLDDLIDEISAQAAANAAILHRNDFIRLDQSRGFDELLINVELCHIINQNGALEIAIAVLCLEDVAQQRRLPRSEEAAKKRDRQLGFSHGREVRREGANYENPFLSREGVCANLPGKPDSQGGSFVTAQ